MPVYKITLIVDPLIATFVQFVILSAVTREIRILVAFAIYRARSIHIQTVIRNHFIFSGGQLGGPFGVTYLVLSVLFCLLGTAVWS